MSSKQVGARDFVQENTEEETFPGSGVYVTQAAKGVGVDGPNDPLIARRISQIVVHNIWVLEVQVGILR